MTAEQVSSVANLILPEILLVAAACVYFLVGPFLAPSENDTSSNVRHGWGLMTLLSLATAGWIAWRHAGTSLEPSSSLPFAVDALTTYIRTIMLAGGAVLLLVSWNQVDDEYVAEHHACLLLIIAGVNLVAAANDLIGLFLSLEMVSIPTYVLLYLARRGANAPEAAIKYFLLSVFSAAVVLYGFSFLFGATGTTNLADASRILTATQGTPMPGFLKVAVVAVIAGLGFRVAIVPFHFYVPDVFQGAPVSGAALLSYVPKVAGLVAMLRLLDALEVHTEIGTQLWTLWTTAIPLLAILSATTMIVGSVMALVQSNVRRLLAWSSISHAGYLLIGLCSVPETSTGITRGVDALLFYLVVYGATTVGFFAVLAGLERSGTRIEKLDDLAGLGRTRPVAALAMTLFLFSLAGLPPTAGFFGKLNLFIAAWSGLVPMMRIVAALMLTSAAIGAGYYLRVVSIMFLRDPVMAPRGRFEIPTFAAAAICVAITLGGFIAPQVLWQAVENIIA